MLPGEYMQSNTRSHMRRWTGVMHACQAAWNTLWRLFSGKACVSPSPDVAGLSLAMRWVRHVLTVNSLPKRQPQARP